LSPVFFGNINDFTFVSKTYDTTQSSNKIRDCIQAIYNWGLLFKVATILQRRGYLLPGLHFMGKGE
jgi:hypothetical protein